MNNTNETTANENTNTIATWLPLFTGFYGSHFDSEFSMDWNAEIEYYESDEYEEGKYKGTNLTSDDFDWDNEMYQTAVAINFVAVINNLLKEKQFITDIKNAVVVSPKFYNFTNDSINCDFVLSEENGKNISEFIHINSEEFTKYLTEQYTTCDGFCSSHSNDFGDWIEETNNFMFNGEQNYGHTLGAVLQFIATQLLLSEEVDGEEDISSHLYQETCEDLYANEYLSFNEELFKSNREQ